MAGEPAADVVVRKLVGDTMASVIVTDGERESSRRNFVRAKTQR